MNSNTKLTKIVLINFFLLLNLNLSVRYNIYHIFLIIMKFLLNILVGGIAIAIAAYIVPGITVASLWTAIFVALVLSLVNATIGLLLQYITIPLNFLTFGIVGFIVTVLMIQLTDGLVSWFNVSSFWSWAVFAVILWLIQWFFWMNDKDFSHKIK